MITFLRRLWTFVRPYKTRFILGLICGIVFALTSGALVVVIKEVVNLVFPPASVPAGSSAPVTRSFAQNILNRLLEHLPRLNANSSQKELILVILTIPAVMFFRSFFNYLNVYLINWVSARAVADLRTKAFAHLQSMPLGFFNQNNTGELISRINHDTQMIRHIIGHSVASLITDPIQVVLLAVLLFIQEPRLTLFAVVVLPLCVVPIVIYARKVRISARAMQGHAGELSKLMHESFTGNRIIKAYNLEETVVARFREVTKRFISHTMRVVRANELPGGLIEFFGSLGVTMILIYVTLHRDGAGSFFANSTMTSGGFVAFIGAIFMMYKPIKSITRLHNQLHQAQAASQRVFNLLDTPNTILDPPTPVPLKAAGADIHFENIDFDYGDKPILRGINLTVKAGQFVAIVGGSGSGKTTLVNLLPRFFDPSKGTVRIGNTDIRTVSIRELRRQIAIVTQETILFHDTIRRNIAYGRPGASDAEIEAAARHAHAHEFIVQKPLGYDTIAGEKGAILSVGQRQRVTIARAVLKDAPILILDEATSALDSESERIVQAALEELMQGRTTICIAHRLSTIQNADVIVVLEHGKIVETGTHAELIQRGGVYRRLYELPSQS